MSDLRFPASLRPIVSKGYSQTRGNNIWRADVQGGLPRQGRDTYFEPVPISITLVVSSLGRQAFLSFLNKIHGGADSFIMVNDTGYGLADHQVMITSPISESTEDGKNWVISFTATAERTAIQEDNCLTENLPDLFGCYGDCLGGFLKTYGVYQTTFPRIWSNEGPAGYPPINMQVQALDSRIVYSGPQVSYINRAGLLATSAANEWPLMYAGGVAVGRVPPENAVTNLVLQSDYFGLSPWVSTRTNLIAGQLTPRGSSDGYKASATAVAGSHFVNQAVSKNSLTTYTYSVFLKAAEQSKVLITVGGSSAAQQNPQNIILDVSSMSILNSPDMSRVDMRAIGSGWIRVSATITTSSTAGDIFAQVSLVDQTSLATSFTGDGVSGLLVWGAQIEVAGKPTSYIKTTTETVTRAAASASVFMNGATSIDITYSDNSVVNVVPINDYATIPQAAAAWGSKFITRIDFNV